MGLRFKSHTRGLWASSAGLALPRNPFLKKRFHVRLGVSPCTRLVRILHCILQ